MIIHQLPLGIPSLASYLKIKGVDNTEVLDLNMAYLQKMRLLWLLYILNKGYHAFVGNISNRLKKREKIGIRPRDNKDGPGLSKREKASFKKMPLSLYRSLNKKINELLDYRKIGKKEKKTIPWSLESIVNFDFSAIRIKDAKKIYGILNPHIKKNSPSLIGISVIYPEQLFFAFLIAKVIKEKIDKNIEIVLGGAQITKHIKYITDNKRLYDFIDFFVTDDGEGPLFDLLEEFPKKRPSDIPNLYFKAQSETKRYNKSNRTFYMRPKDFLLPDFRGFDLTLYRNQIPVLASKGCYWSKCNFCTYASMRDCRYSIAAAENVLETIKGLKGLYGIMSYHFVDDALPPRFMKQLAQGLDKDKLDIRWASSIILSKEFASKDFCASLKNSGLYQVSIGLESISSRILNLMNKCHKNLNESEIEEILVNLKDAGIKVGIHIIFGFPTETVDEARQTLNFLVKNRTLYDTCMYQPFCLEDNTPVFNHPERFAITKIYKENKDSGERLGYRYEVSKGMNQEESKRFTYEEAARDFKAGGVNVRSSE